MVLENVREYGVLSYRVRAIYELMNYQTVRYASYGASYY